MGGDFKDSADDDRHCRFAIAECRFECLQSEIGNRQCAPVEEIKHNVQKERRICDTLEPVIQSHRLVVNAALIQKDFDSTQAYSFEHHQRYQLFFQMTRITRDRGALAKDDRLDAVAIAVAYWAKAMAVETDKAVESNRERLMKLELERYIKHAIGSRPNTGRVYASTMHIR